MNDTDNSLFMETVSTADGSDAWQLMEGTGVPQRNYKDTVFRLLFNDREKLLSLFNAVNGTSYHKTEELEIITLQNAVYLNKRAPAERGRRACGERMYQGRNPKGFPVTKPRGDNQYEHIGIRSGSTYEAFKRGILC